MTKRAQPEAATRAYAPEELQRLMAPARREPDSDATTIARPTMLVPPTRVLRSALHASRMSPLSQISPRASDRASTRERERRLLWFVACCVAALAMATVVVAIAISTSPSPNPSPSPSPSQSPNQSQSQSQSQSQNPSQSPNQNQNPRLTPLPVASLETDAGSPSAADHDLASARATPSGAAAAIDALAAGREREALLAYRSLARARPEQPVFGIVVSILTRKLAARCKRQLEVGGAPCDLPP